MGLHDMRNRQGESVTGTSLRQRNRAAALTSILRSGKLTRADISRACGLSTASAANVVSDLISEGLVAEIGSQASRGGRPIAILGPRAEGAYSIGADVSERGATVELFDLRLTVVDREFREGQAQETPEGIQHDLQDAILALRERNEHRWSRVVGVGLGLPGVVEGRPGEQMLYGQSLAWDPVRIPPRTADNLPVFAENGAKTLARAELWFGAGRGVEHAAVALLGRGVGLGLISEGEIQRGAYSSATEWGHMAIRFDGELCRCGLRGCLESYIGGDAILRNWEKRGGRFTGTGWQAMDALLDAAQTDETAAVVIAEVIEALGVGLGNIVNLANPQRIVIGGWAGMRLMERYSVPIHEAIVRHSLRRPAEQFDLATASFAGDTVALGAALIPIEEKLINAW